MSDLKIESMRSLDDFALNTARFEVPKMDSWGRRLKANLLYYQTNYFVVFIVVFLLMGLLRPTEVLVGMIVTLGCGFILHMLSERPGATEKIRNNHPLLCLAGITGIVVLILGYFFLMAIILPILIILLHASMRLRNLSNKVANQVEKLGIKKSPMGILLDELGLAFELFED